MRSTAKASTRLPRNEDSGERDLFQAVSRNQLLRRWFRGEYGGVGGDIDGPNMVKNDGKKCLTRGGLEGITDA